MILGVTEARKEMKWSKQARKQGRKQGRKEGRKKRRYARIK